MWLSVGMCRQRNMPNPENCALAELETAAKASSVQRSYVRLMAIKALIMGLPHKQVAALFGVNEDSVSRWVRRFNQRGIDGLTEGPRSGRPPKISGEQAYEYSKLVLHPELVNETHWTGRKFHGSGTSGNGVAACAPDGGSTLGGGNGGLKVPVRTMSSTCPPSRVSNSSERVRDQFELVAVVADDDH